MSGVSEFSRLSASGGPSHLVCTWHGGGAAAWVQVQGEVDLASASHLRATIAEASYGVRVVVVDLRGVTFMDSTGLYVLVDADHKARESGCRLVCVRGPSSLSRLLTITGLEEQLEIVDLDPAEPASQALLPSGPREHNGTSRRRDDR